MQYYTTRVAKVTTPLLRSLTKHRSVALTLLSLMLLIPPQSFADDTIVKDATCGFDYGVSFDSTLLNVPNPMARTECIDRRIRISLRVNQDDLLALANQRSVDAGFPIDPITGFGRWRPGYPDYGWWANDRIELEIFQGLTYVTAKEQVSLVEPLVLGWIHGHDPANVGIFPVTGKTTDEMSFPTVFFYRNEAETFNVVTQVPGLTKQLSKVKMSINSKKRNSSHEKIKLKFKSDDGFRLKLKLNLPKMPKDVAHQTTPAGYGTDNSYDPMTSAPIFYTGSNYFFDDQPVSATSDGKWWNQPLVGNDQAANHYIGYFRKRQNLSGDDLAAAVKQIIGSKCENLPAGACKPDASGNDPIAVIMVEGLPLNIYEVVGVSVMRHSQGYQYLDREWLVSPPDIEDDDC